MNLFKIFLSIFLFASYVFSYEIRFSKEFSKTLKEDLLSSNISINVNSQSEDEVNELISKFSSFIGSYENELIEKENSRYSVYPKYKYIDNEAILVSYNGILNYSFQSVDESSLNEFLRQIIALKTDENESVLITNLSWKVDSRQLNSVYSDLRTDSILWIKEYQRVLSKKVQDSCKVQEINFSSYRGYTPILRSAKKINEIDVMSNLPSLQKDDKEIKVNVNYVLECK